LEEKAKGEVAGEKERLLGIDCIFELLALMMVS
jgi:hypothetical protein